MNTKGIWERLDQWFRLSRLSFPVPAHSKHLYYSLGGITFVGFLILFFSGLYLTQFFDAHPDKAYQSVKTIMTEVPGGRFIRSLHYWTAQAVVIALCLHLLRVFITGAYKFPRTMTWYLGVALFFTATMGSYFSGTVVKWDQEGFEALDHYKLTVAAFGPLGYWLGENLTGAVSMNLRMYTYHITLAPLAIVFLVVGHFYLIHVFNISPLPRGVSARLTEVPKEELTGTFTEHLRTIFLSSLIYYGAVAVLSLMIPAPIGNVRSDEMTGEKPPWLYLWMYGIENLTGIFGILYGTLALLILMLLIPLLDRGPSRDPIERKGILAVGIVTILILASFTLYAWIAPPQVHEGHVHPTEESTSPPHGHDEAPAAEAPHPADMPPQEAAPTESKKPHTHPPGEEH
jgi:ubiquinol-cytochrome c reductase cytochrome b subunit